MENPTRCTPLGDTSYTDRHSQRNRKRVARVMAHCTPGEYALDIGCNTGYFSWELLQRGLAQRVDAIEYDPTIVEDDLKEDPRFSLHSGDAIAFSFQRRYHTAIYGALHHHLFARHGYARAMRFWLDVVDHTDSLIFFESGQLAEGCRWYWQRALREYYSSDEDYFADLLFAVGPRLKSVRLIGRYWIHGVRRWLLRIELWPAEKALVPTSMGPPVQVERFYRRTIGSVGQKLISEENTYNLKVHEGVSFRVGTTADGQKVFCKKYVADQKEKQEFDIAAQINDPRFVIPLDHTTEDGLILPLIDLPRLDSVPRVSIGDKAKFRRELLELFRFATEKHIVIEFEGRRELRLIDVIDLHPSNIFYDESGPSIWIFDLEMHSLASWPRNRMNLAKILLRWCKRDMITVVTVAACTVAYVWSRSLITLRRPERRAAERTVSVLGSAYMRLREALDRRIIALIPGFRQ